MGGSEHAVGLRRLVAYGVFAVMVVVAIWQGFVLQEAQERAVAAEQRFRRAVASAGGLWEWTPEGFADLSGEVWYSDCLLEQLGFSPGDWEPNLESFHARVHPDDWVRTARHLRQLCGAISGPDVLQWQVRLRHRDGRWLWFLVTGRRDLETGKVSGSVVNIDDYVRKEELLDKIFELCPVAIVVCDDRGNALHFNPAAEELFRYSAAEVVGQPFSRLIADGQRALHDRSYAAAVERIRRSPGDWELRQAGMRGFGRRKDGSLVPVSVSMRGVRFSDHIRMVAVITRQDYAVPGHLRPADRYNSHRDVPHEHRRIRH